MSLTGKQVRHLRSLAHHLKPVVLVGGQGVSEAVVKKTDVELENHERIKVRIDGDRGDVTAAAERLVDATRAQLAQRIGRTLVLYRRRSEDPTIVLPRA